MAIAKSMGNQITNQFETQGYVILRSVIDPLTAQFLKDYAVRCALGGETTNSDPQVPGTPSAYGAPLMEKLLVKLAPAIERASGRDLFPTYSFFRVYKKGDTLARHKDRAACEVSLSICLGYRAPAPWPLFVAGHSGVFAAELQEGDGLLYKGVDCEHWRESFDGEMAAQVFLHYVDQKGPYAAWRFDKRVREPS
jgi:hypothetical protein